MDLTADPKWWVVIQSPDRTRLEALEMWARDEESALRAASEWLEFQRRENWAEHKVLYAELQ